MREKFLANTLVNPAKFRSAGKRGRVCTGALNAVRALCAAGQGYRYVLADVTGTRWVSVVLLR